MNLKNRTICDDNKIFANSTMLVEPGTDNNSTENCDESLPDELITVLVM